jgi:hypothetical protein
MNIAIPETLEIFGVEYKVIWVDDLDGAQVAQIHFMEGTIEVLNNGMSADIYFVSFMHEVVHGVLQGMNYFLGGRIYHDESFVERLSQGFAQVFKQIMKHNQEVELVEGSVEDEEMPDTDILNINIEGFE